MKDFKVTRQKIYADDSRNCYAYNFSYGEQSKTLYSETEKIYMSTGDRRMWTEDDERKFKESGILEKSGVLEKDDVTSKDDLFTEKIHEKMEDLNIPKNMLGREKLLKDEPIEQINAYDYIMSPKNPQTIKKVIMSAYLDHAEEELLKSDRYKQLSEIWDGKFAFKAALKVAALESLSNGEPFVPEKTDEIGPIQTKYIVKKLEPALLYDEILKQEKLDKILQTADLESKAKQYMKDNISELSKSQEYKSFVLAQIVQRGGQIKGNEDRLPYMCGKALWVCAVKEFDKYHYDYHTEKSRVENMTTYLRNEVKKKELEKPTPAEAHLYELSFSANRKYPFYQLSFQDFSKLIREEEGKEQLILSGGEKKQFYRMLDEKDYTICGKTYEQNNNYVGFVLKDDKNSQKAVIVHKETGERIDFKNYIESFRTFDDIMKGNSEIQKYNQSVENDLIAAIEGVENIQKVKENLKPVLDKINEKRYLLEPETEKKVKDLVLKIKIMEMEQKQQKTKDINNDEIYQKNDGIER